MSLKERLQQDWKNAVKARNKFRANTISMAKAAVLQAEKSDGNKLEDNEIVDILAKEVKQRRDAIIEFKKGNRQDLAEQNAKEIEILLEYLPQQLTEDEISDIVSKAAYEVGANSMKDIGKIMSAIMPIVKGRADGKLVNTIVRQYLNK